MTLRPLLLCGLAILPLASQAAAPPRPFYAFDNAFARGPAADLPRQLDLVKELGFDGVAWREQPPAQVADVAKLLADRGLKMTTIYCAAKVTPEGDLTHSPDLPKLMEALKGRGTIVWLHIGGKGPAFDALTAEAPVVRKLRALADTAAANGLRVAIYPHYGEWTARFADATRLAKLVARDAFGVTFNLCHALATGDEARIPELLEQAKPLLLTVSLNGADAGVQGPKWPQLIQTLDKGTYDVAALLKTLDKINFTGPVGFQGYNVPGDPRAVLTPTMTAWRKLTVTPRGAR